MQQGIVPAPAKLTVHLHVTGIRADGYHLLESEMVTLDLADTLEFSEGNGLDVVGDSTVPVTDDNLVVRALDVIGMAAHVRLTKRIPAGGGLGGASADAAAVLRWAGVDDPGIAAKIGADVPFCVRGGRAQVTGIGEILKPLFFEPRNYTLLTPPFGVNTVAVYRAFDEAAGLARDKSERNHLQRAALAVEPRLRYWKDLMREHTGAEPCLAGSGSTWFVEGEWAEPDQLGEARWTVAKTVPEAS